jgi:hypothetical protein
MLVRGGHNCCFIEKKNIFHSHCIEDFMDLTHVHVLHCRMVMRNVPTWRIVA